MKIENATLKESLESIAHLTSLIHRLRLPLLEVILSYTFNWTEIFTYEAGDMSLVRIEGNGQVREVAKYFINKSTNY